jgi:hypothetical protein
LEHAVESVRDRTVSLPGGVLVAEGGLVGVVAEAVHDFLGAGAGAGREGSGQMAEVMEVQLR